MMKNLEIKINPKKILTYFKTDYVVSFLLIAVIAVSFFAGALWSAYQGLGINKVASTDDTGSDAVVTNVPTAPEATNPVPKPTSKDNIRGAEKAKIAIIEYSDFTCPYCGVFHKTAKEAVAEYSDSVQWVYRHFPRSQGAEIFSEASECASEVGGKSKFWDYADELYSLSNLPDEEGLTQIAVDLGLNKAKFESCLTNGDKKNLVVADRQTGINSGVKGTPGNFLMNLETGETIDLGGALPLDNLKQAIDSMLK